jgi:hypothetical protein
MKKTAAVFEEYDDLLKLYEYQLLMAGFEPVIMASDVNEAAKKINAYEGSLDVALTDLDPGPHRPEERHTVEVISLLRKKFGDAVHIVAVDEFGEKLPGANALMEKLDLPKGFIRHIQSLDEAA